MPDATTSPETGRAPGRPQRRDEHGLATRERLLDAAVAACVERGYEGTTMADIARRVGIRVPSIYNYYPTKSALLVAATRRAFDQRLGGLADARLTPPEVVGFMLSPELRHSRRLALELRAAATRHPELAEFFDEWHDATARAFLPFAEGPDADERIKLFFLIVLGLCHVDEFGSVPGSVSLVQDQLAAMVADLFATSDGPGTAQGEAP